MKQQIKENYSDTFLYVYQYDSTKTIRLLALKFHDAIVDFGFVLINYHFVDESS